MTDHVGGSLDLSQFYVCAKSSVNPRLFGPRPKNSAWERSRPMGQAPNHLAERSVERSRSRRAIKLGSIGDKQRVNDGFSNREVRHDSLRIRPWVGIGPR